MKYRSNGKLLITGEYLVLKGAKALAIPTSFGQELMVTEHDEGIKWHTSVRDESVFSAEFKLNGDCLSSGDEEISNRLSQVFKSIIDIKKKKLLDSCILESKLDFPMTWGLGSSSTLINNLASWSDTDPFELLAKTFGGSAYDIACAMSDTPIIYSIKEGSPDWQEAEFNPPFHESIHFVYLNQKKDSRQAMKQFNSLSIDDMEASVQKMDLLTEAFCMAKKINEFKDLIDTHEAMMSDILKTETIKKQLFKEYPHPIKSLGGWGGDFVMAIGNTDEMTYFSNKGYNTIIPFKQMILRNSAQNR